MKITSNPNRVRMALHSLKRAKTEKQRSLKREVLKEAFAYYQFTRQSGTTKLVGIPSKDTTLSKKEEFVLRMRDEGNTFARIGKELGLTRERIIQIEKKARNKNCPMCKMLTAHNQGSSEYQKCQKHKV